MREAIDRAMDGVAWGALIDEKIRGLAARHAEIILERNEVVNLTRITDPDEVAVRHVLDSFWLIPALDSWDADLPQRYLDFGSGGGWPFVPLAAYFGSEAWCSEKVGKKSTILKEVCAELLPRATIFPKQVRELRKPKFNLITNRAVGKLAKTFDDSHHAVNKGGLWVAYKGPNVEEELDEWRAMLRGHRFKELPLIETALPDGSTRVFVGARKK